MLMIPQDPSFSTWAVHSPTITNIWHIGISSQFKHFSRKSNNSKNYQTASLSTIDYQENTFNTELEFFNKSTTHENSISMIHQPIPWDYFWFPSWTRKFILIHLGFYSQSKIFQYNHLWVSNQEITSRFTCENSENLQIEIFIHFQLRLRLTGSSIILCIEERELATWEMIPTWILQQYSFNWVWFQSLQSREWFQHLFTHTMLNLESGIHQCTTKKTWFQNQMRKQDSETISWECFSFEPRERRLSNSWNMGLLWPSRKMTSILHKILRLFPVT